MSRPPLPEEVSTGLSKKELALYIGVPVAAVCVAGAAYYFLSTDDSNKDKSAVENNEEDEEQLDPLKRAELSKVRGNKFFKGKKYEEAIKCYSKAITLCQPENAKELSTFYQNRAAAYEQLKNWDEVMIDCTNAIQYNKKYSKALARRARAHENLKMMRECLQDATAVCLIEGFQAQSRDSIAQADRALKELGKNLAAEHYKKRNPVLPSATFIKSYMDSFYEDSFDCEFTDEDKESSSYYKAVEEKKAGQFANIIELCSAEIDDEGRYAGRALLLRATLYTLMSNVTAAMNDFEKILAMEESDDNKKIIVNALIKRGSLFMQETKDKECFADFERAEKLLPQSADIYHHRGQIYFLIEKLDKAAEDFQKAIEFAPGFVHPKLQVAYCTCRLAMQLNMPSKLQEANIILEDAIKKHPDAAEAWSLYGQLLQDQQRFTEAGEKIEKAIELQPQNPTNYVYKALLELQSKQDMDAAQKLIEKSIEVDDKCDFAYETLATLHVQRGELDKSIEYFGKALELVRTETEMAHTYSLLEAAKAQDHVTKTLGISLPPNNIM